MHNNMHLHDTWDAYRKEVRKLRDTYDKRMKQLERYADSVKGREDMEKAEKDFRDGLAALADSYRSKFDGITNAMAEAVKPESMTPPSPEQLSLLQMLNLRDNLESSEIEAAVKTLGDNDAAIKTLGDIVTRKGKILPPSWKPFEVQQREAVASIKRAVNSLLQWDGRTGTEVVSDYFMARNDFKYGGGPAVSQNALASRWAADIEAGAYYADTARHILGDDASRQLIDSLD